MALEIRDLRPMFWPAGNDSLLQGALLAALGRKILRFTPKAPVTLVEYEDFPAGVVMRFEAALQKGEAEDSPEGFRRFASQTFGSFHALRTKWLSGPDPASEPDRLILPRAAFRADPGAWLAYFQACLDPEADPPGAAEMAEMTTRVRDWMATQPAPDVTAFRHYDPALFDLLGRLNLPRQVVLDTFRQVMRRPLEEKNVLHFQTKVDLDDMLKGLWASAEYRNRIGTAPTLIHLHVPKSAGTSLTKILADNFGPGEKLAADPARLDVIDRMPEAARGRLRLIFGHLQHGLHRRLARPALYVCALRQPGPRLLSYYNYMKRREDHPLHKVLNTNVPSFGRFLEFCAEVPEQRPETDNGQMRRIAGRMDVKDLGNEAAIFREALRNIFAPDMIFGLTEHFDLLLDELVSRGLIPSYEPVVANAAPEKASFDAECMALTPRQQELLGEFTRWDQALYDICRIWLLGLDDPEEETAACNSGSADGRLLTDRR